MTKLTGFPVYLKLENVQPVASFKIRGVGNLCQKVGQICNFSLLFNTTQQYIPVMVLYCFHFVQLFGISLIFDILFQFQTYGV